MRSPASDTLVLVLYPLSAAYRCLLEEKLGTKPVYVLVSELRKDGLRGLLRNVWHSRYRRVVLPYEVPEAKSVLSILQLIGAVHKLPQLEVCNPDGEFRPVRPLEVIRGCFGLLIASISGWRARRRSCRAARHLIVAKQMRYPLKAGTQRVLYLKNNLWFGLRAGGSVGHVAGVINGLVELGHEVCFVSPEAPKYLSPKVCAKAVDLFRNYALPTETNLFRLQEYAVKAALDAAQSFRPTLIYQRLSLGDWTGAEVANVFGVPLIVEYNGSELWVARNWGGNVRYAAEMATAEEAMLRRADLIFTVSRPLYDELLSRGHESSRIAWYPNCVDPKIYDSIAIPAEAIEVARSHIGTEKGDYVIMFVGTFGLWHGAEIFAQAAGRMAKDSRWMRESRAKFVFVGDGKTKAKCEEIIRLSPAANYTVFTGLVPQHEARNYLAIADAFVAPHVPNADKSRFFGSPTKLFEYMAMARPIVASNLDQIGEVLEHGRTAVLVEPGNVESLVSGLRTVAENRIFGVDLGAAARGEVLSKYTWTRHVAEILNALGRKEAIEESKKAL